MNFRQKVEVEISRMIFTLHALPRERQGNDWAKEVRNDVDGQILLLSRKAISAFRSNIVRDYKIVSHPAVAYLYHQVALLFLKGDKQKRIVETMKPKFEEILRVDEEEEDDPELQQSESN